MGECQRISGEKYGSTLLRSFSVIIFLKSVVLATTFPLQVWQAFVGVKARRIERYYQDLLAQEASDGQSKEHDDTSGVPKKWKRQIEKVIRCILLGL